jgi:hypothetical protein
MGRPDLGRFAGVLAALVDGHVVTGPGERGGRLGDV